MFHRWKIFSYWESHLEGFLAKCATCQKAFLREVAMKMWRVVSGQGRHYVSMKDTVNIKLIGLLVGSSMPYFQWYTEHQK